VKREEPVPAVERVAERPATIINDVQIDPITADQVDVVLYGNGSMNYEVFELTNPSRLVIDVKSVSVVPGLGFRQDPGQEVLSKVRVAQFQTVPKVVRAVIDLNRKVPYNVMQEGTQLRIELGDRTDVPQAKSDSSAIPPPPLFDNLKATTSESQQETPARADAGPSQPEKIEPAKPAAVQPVKYEEPKIAQADPKQTSNEQFFSFEPDTTLFAQETTTIPTTNQAPQDVPGTQGGMGTLDDREGTAQKEYTGEPFSFDFKDIDIKDLFRFIADISGLNVILDPSVRGSVTLKLTEVPWDQALDLITKNQGLGYTIEGNVIRIAPLSKIEAEEQQRRRVEEQQFLSAPLVTKIVPVSYAKAQEVDTIVKRLLTKKGSSIIDRRTNKLIITDINTNIDSIVNLIETLDSRTTQVVIE
ncbi:MAG: secretin and TonB N-terminal domain-containing protein, partial [Acidobacteriota bacterium]